MKNSRVTKLAERLSVTLYRREYATPGIGPYYWIPEPSGKYRLESFVVSREHDTPDHSEYWERVVVFALADLWGKPDIAEHLKNIPYGVPRGRVSFFNGVYFINHGEDTPDFNWLEIVCKDFNLSTLRSTRPEKVIVSPDSHERMLSRDKLKVNKILGLD